MEEEQVDRVVEPDRVHPPLRRPRLRRMLGHRHREVVEGVTEEQVTALTPQGRRVKGVPTRDPPGILPTGTPTSTVHSSWGPIGPTVAKF